MYFIISITFAIGIIVGAITIKMLGAEEKNEIMLFLNSFFKAVDNNDLNNMSIFKQSILDNFEAIIMIWISSIIYIGIFIVPIIILFRGFALGFSVGFFVCEYGIKGFLFSILGIFPQNLLIIPGMISIASMGMAFSFNRIKIRKLRMRNKNTTSNIVDYSISILIFSILVFIGCLIEAYLAPTFLRLLTDYLN